MSKLFIDRLALQDFQKNPSDLAMADCVEAMLSRAKGQAEIAASAAWHADSEFSRQDLSNAIRSIALEIGDAQDVLDVWWNAARKKKK